MMRADGSISDPDVLQSASALAPVVGDETRSSFASQAAGKQLPAGRAADPFLGQILAGHYRVEARIGEGGMCAVYRALDLTLNRSVAVKVLLPGRLLEEGLLRFQREARTVGALDHPNIMRIFELNTTEAGEPFMVMEFLEGDTLAGVLKSQEELSFERLVNIVRQCAHALACAHAKGFVHRDVKPGNIIIVKSPSGDDIVKLVDFGIAHIADPSTMQLTHTGDVFGSPYYMSPEQCRGDRVNSRSDIYSLGCVLYECLVKKPPFLGSSALDTLRLHVETIPVAPSRIVKGLRLGAQVDHVILRCLEKSAERRYQTADQLADDLSSLLSREKSSFNAIGANVLRRLPCPNFNQRSLTRKLIVAYSLILPLMFLWTGIPRTQAWFDKIWNDIEVSGQQAMDRGEYGKARIDLEHSLRVARYLPVSRKQAKVGACLRDLQELAFLVKDNDALVRWQKEERTNSPAAAGPEIQDGLSAQRKLILHNLQGLELSKSSDAEGLRKAAEQVIGRACDLSVRCQSAQTRATGYLLMKEVFERACRFVPESCDAYRRICVNLALFSSSADKSNFGMWMEKAKKCLRKNEGLPAALHAKILSDFAMAYSQVSMSDEAMVCINQALQRLSMSPETQSEVAGEIYVRKAMLDQLAGNADSSAFYMLQARLALRNASPGTFREQQLLSAQIFNAANGIASKEALSNCFNCLKRLEAAHSRPEYFAISLCRVGELCGRLGKLQLCQSLCLRAYALTHDRDTRLSVYSLSTLAMALASHGKTADAEPYMVQARQLAARDPAQFQSFLSCSLNLAAIYSRQGRFADAFKVLQAVDNKEALSGRLPQSMRKQLYTQLSRLAEKLGERQAASHYQSRLTEAVKS